MNANHEWTCSTCDHILGVLDLWLDEANRTSFDITYVTPPDAIVEVYTEDLIYLVGKKIESTLDDPHKLRIVVDNSSDETHYVVLDTESNAVACFIFMEGTETEWLDNGANHSRLRDAIISLKSSSIRHF